MTETDCLGVLEHPREKMVSYSLRFTIASAAQTHHCLDLRADPVLSKRHGVMLSFWRHKTR